MTGIWMRISLMAVFICAMYGKAKYDSVDEVRHLMLKSKCDGDITVQS
jgi:hypothetical protein